MRVLIFHGYLLDGTGSNVYNARLAEALTRQGHEVHLLCQERRPFDFGWVVAAGDWDGGELRVAQREGASAEGRATVYRPDIGGLLPVYVPDRYEGVRALPLYEVDDALLDAYVEANVRAVRDVVERAKPDFALANHLVMGPLVLARALQGTGIPRLVKIHGSALEYVVKPHPRFLPHAREGLAGARAVLVGSRHTAESLWAAMDDEGLPGRTRLGPPGVDVGAFRPLETGAARDGLEALRARLHAAAPIPTADPVNQVSSSPSSSSSSSSFARDASEGARALAALDPAADRIVVFVGKLIASKGVELLLAAWPRVVEAEPRARLVIVGFGSFRAGLEGLAADLAAGDLAAARATVGEDGRRLPELDAFLARADETALRAAGAAMRRVVWTGRLDHGELADLLPAAEAIVVPSTFPEAFGMVAAEGAACGALPVVARHSGLAEVSEALAADVPESVRPWLSFEVGPDSVVELASCLAGWLTAPEAVRAATREAIVAVARERWSWDGVARTLLSAATDDLGDLPSP